MKTIVTFLVALATGALVFFYVLGLLLSDAFQDAFLLLALLAAVGVAAYFLAALGLGMAAPHVRVPLGIALALPAVLVSIVLFLGVAVQQSLVPASFWLAAAIGALLLSLLGTSIGARKRLEQLRSTA